MRGGSFRPKADTRKLSLARASAGPAGPAGAVDEPTRFGAGVLAVFQHLHAVDEHVVDSGRELLGLFERRVVLDRGGIEHDHVAIIAGLEEPALLDAEVGGGERA